MWNLIEAISLPSFIGLGCLDQTLREVVEPPPPSELHALIKPRPYRVKACAGSLLHVSKEKKLCCSTLKLKKRNGGKQNEC